MDIEERKAEVRAIYMKDYKKSIDLAGSGLTVNFKWIDSSVFRLINLANAYYGISIDKANMDYSVFRMSKRGSKQSIYAFLYTKPNGKHKYICYSNTYQSMDGEYRNTFITYDKFMVMYDKYANMFNEIRKVLTRRIYIDVITDRDDVYDIAAKLLAVSWYFNVENLTGKAVPNHIYREYIDILFDTHDILVFKKLEKKYSEIYGIDKMIFMKIYFTKFYSFGKQKVSYINIGMKLYPLPILQLENLGNIKSAAWREIYILTKTNKLIVNGVCPGFPFYFDWFSMRNSSEALYDNEGNRIKYKYSEVAKEIVKDVESARDIDEDYFRNKFFKKIGEQLESTMDFTEEHLVLSQLSIATIIENIGKTFVDYTTLTLKDSRKNMLIGPIFTDIVVFKKYLFEYLYTMYCLHERLGIIHGDLHLNNITMFSWYLNVFTNNTLIRPDMQLAWNVNGKIYITPNYSKISGIIDYSRSFIHENTLRNEFHPLELEDILSHQRDMILAAYKRDLPDFYNKYKDSILASMLGNKEAFWNSLKAIDIYRLTKSMSLYIETLSIDKKNIKEMTSFLNMINKYAESILTGLVVDIDNPHTNSPIDNKPHTNQSPVDNKPHTNQSPVEYVINTYFKLFENIENIDIADYFNSNAELVYNFEDNLHPIFSLEHIKKYKIPHEDIILKVQKEKLAEKDNTTELKKDLLSKEERRGSVGDQ